MPTPSPTRYRLGCLSNPAVREATLRPVSGRAVLLALRRRPRTGDLADMVERTDRVGGLPGTLERRLAGGEG